MMMIIMIIMIIGVLPEVRQLLGEGIMFPNEYENSNSNVRRYNSSECRRRYNSSDCFPNVSEGIFFRTDRMKVAECLGQPHQSNLMVSVAYYVHIIIRIIISIISIIISIIIIIVLLVLLL